ncbi:hypothetical protein UFOVP1290_87 [uncultured Caudovirales phage]|uniref:Uncharacterized protein n=1 Tax=uncultured Caudovirales phage TaxID=2100421 RepID=A0A6J5RQL4_9CAUD|nr:hypothetical protein UFOVP1290_87 [uncultured Caudovirales phage]
MKHELKFIMSGAMEDNVITNPKTEVYVNDCIVGCIQDIKIHANTKSILPTIEITFPNFRSPEVDKSYLSSVNNLSTGVDLCIDMLKQFPNIKIKLQNIFATCSDEEDIEEVGTYGIIERVPTDI